MDCNKWLDYPSETDIGWEWVRFAITAQKHWKFATLLYFGVMNEHWANYFGQSGESESKSGIDLRETALIRVRMN